MSSTPSGDGLRRRPPRVGEETSDEPAGGGDASPARPPARHHTPRSAVPLSMQVMRPFWLMSSNCPDCPAPSDDAPFYEAFFAGNASRRHRHPRLEDDRREGRSEREGGHDDD